MKKPRRMKGTCIWCERQVGFLDQVAKCVEVGGRELLYGFCFRCSHTILPEFDKHVERVEQQIYRYEVNRKAGRMPAQDAGQPYHPTLTLETCQLCGWCQSASRFA